MIEYLKGNIDSITPTNLIIEVQGIGYSANISLNTYTKVQHQKECKLYIYELIREDAYILYGFVEKAEREIFTKLISVSGIGGNTARTILSTFTPEELFEAISAGDVEQIKRVKGIGLKTAQRVIVDLKGKLQLATTEESAAPTIATREEAISALTTLGFNPSASQKIVTIILKEDATLKVEQVIKSALKRL